MNPQNGQARHDVRAAGRPAAVGRGTHGAVTRTVAPRLLLLLLIAQRTTAAPKCSTVREVEPGVKVVRCEKSCPEHEMVGVVETPTGQRCTFLSGTECSADGRTDGVVWEAVNQHYLGAPNHERHERSAANMHEIWFADASEVHSPPYNPRPIGDAQWLTPMNYARHYGLIADYPYVRPKQLSWPAIEPSLFRQKTQWIVYLSSNCNVQSQRDDFMLRASHFLDIDSLGGCVRNKDTPVRIKAFEEDSEGNNLRQTWQDYTAGTNAILVPYRFRLLIISTICDDYFVEKISQTLEAGAIPIYLGMPNSHDWDPGLAAGVHPAMIHVQDFDGLAELAEFVLALGADTEEARARRLRYFEYQGRPPVVFPRHGKDPKWWQFNKSGGMDWTTYVCLRTHDGDPHRHIKPQPMCRGPWWQYFQSLGKNLSRWGCSATHPCALSPPAVAKNTSLGGTVVLGVVVLFAGLVFFQLRNFRRSVMLAGRSACRSRRTQDLCIS